MNALNKTVGLLLVIIGILCIISVVFFVPGVVLGLAGVALVLAGLCGLFCDSKHSKRQILYKRKTTPDTEKDLTKTQDMV